MKCRAWLVMLALVLAACGDREERAPQERRLNAPAGVEDTAREVSGPERHILAFGDSLFAGYRLNEGEGYPDRLEATLREKGINATVNDAGVSGDTSAAGLQRIAFVLDSLDAPPDLALVELGGNDLLRGVSPAETRANLSAILAELQKRNIPVLLMGMRAPPNLGADYVAEFDGLYRDLAEQYDARLVPFFLEPIYGRPTLMQQDRIHPTAEGVDALVAATVDDVMGAMPEASE